ncbi:hypothetical protein FHJ31_24495 [Pseudomonas sp. Fig-3]|uniref:hypothetical protein n=1 Tax=unclassified Pseudomonas TaxID=196821 RepID=UPI0010EECB68|nr:MULTISPECIES: hypothetical protein [unclassified Pseudomonas]TNB78786.1 hypothetical protein FHJ31_24495 [Pseudomonas sp. Fig-3]VII92862.1 hypothetical protein [Pseudomonas sp. FG-3G]
MKISPYSEHHDILLSGKYGTAHRLQEAVISLYNPNRFAFCIDHHWGGFDTYHRQIYEKLVNWFHEHGPEEKSFQSICERIIADREEQALICAQELTNILSSSPFDYPSEDGIPSEDNYCGQVNLLKHHLKSYSEKGFFNSKEMLRILAIRLIV